MAVAQLWPSLDGDSAGEARQEVLAFYAYRADAPERLWLELLLGAKNQIDLFANASLFLPEDNQESIDIIRHKAEGGIPVRILLGDPDSPEMELPAGKNGSMKD